MKKIEHRDKIHKAVILAGGLGTRFLPATLVVAKELFPICEQPILMYHLEDLAKAGITDILIVGNKLKEESFMTFITPPKEYLEKVEKDGKLNLLEKYNNLMEKFNSFTYINQEIGSDYFNKENNVTGEQRGSSIAILSCKEWAKGEPFIVFNGDDFCVYPDGTATASDLINVYNQTGDYVVYGREVSRDLIYKYSSMVIGEKHLSCNGFKMNDIIEKPVKGTEPSNIMGFAKYVFTGDVFDRILKSKPRKNGEFCITDVISDVAREGKTSTCIFDGLYYDCGSRLGLQMAGNYVLFKDGEDKEALIEQFDKLKTIFK